MEFEQILEVNLKNGTTCTHLMKMPSEDDWWDFVVKVTAALNTETGAGLLTVPKPFGIHRMSEVSSIHFGDLEPPPDRPAIGFVTS